MTADQEQHLQRVKDQFLKAVDAKYRGGVREHGGNLWDKAVLELIDEGMQEAVDQYVYLATARENILCGRKPPASG